VFDDAMLATIFRQTPADARSRGAAWRQLADILAQRGKQLSDSDARRALHGLALLRPQVSETVRRETAGALASHCRFAPLVALYAADQPAIAAAMLGKVQLADAEWMALLPSSTPAARAILAERGDLSPAVRRALASLGAGAAALPSAPLSVQTNVPAPAGQQSAKSASDRDDDPSAEGGESTQIRDLVRRIDSYRARQRDGGFARQVQNFLFETGPDGVICWAEGIARGAVIGLSLAEPALGAAPGVDGAVAGAFRRRSEIINARLVLAGSSDYDGEWRMSALPWFDGPTGQFRGYRGNVRRPRRNEVAYGTPVASEGGDSVRQLIHELRSPLNAISGFGQIIAGQMFGPVNHRYRSIAASIVDDAAVLQDIIEDLDSSARGVVPVDTDAADVIDLNALLMIVETELAPLVTERDVQWSVTRIGSDFTARLPRENARRMFGRLLTALVDVTESGETLLAQLIAGAGHGRTELRIVRPRAIRHSSAAELLDPGFNPRGDAPGAAMLSLGFSLRLVDSLARGCGGNLEIGANALTLRLPARQGAALDGVQGGYAASPGSRMGD
jgi:signal transduction histidine kinase